ncbi:MAG: acetyl-CoA hydrolase/transferase family protein [Verrucomicrobiota bacterium]
MSTPLPKLTAAEAASLINDGDTIGFSGFTPAGSPKAVSLALAERAKALHAEGKPFKVGVVTGASTGKSLDGALALADAISFRTPYQSNADLRKSINAGKTRYFDMHLSMVAQTLRYGFLGKVNWAVIEACDVTPEGEIVVTSGVGIAPTACRLADKIIIELNANHPAALRGFHDIYEPLDPPHRREIPVYKPSDRIGSPVIKVDPAKIVGVVVTNQPDETGGFDEATDVTKQIGENVANFLASEMKAGRIPAEFLPIQSGVGNIANAVLGALGIHPDIPAFEMYTEVIQDSVIGLIRNGKIKFASGSSLTLSNDVLKSIYDDIEFFRARIVLRPQEISNNPEIVRRLGLITINTAIEVDVFGNINSTHIMGKNMMNGIGGSGDFTRNAYLSIFTCPSVAKGGAISAIVPFASHLDHSEHSVSAVITENGVADLRGKSPQERALEIIDKCAHPDYRGLLHAYLDYFPNSHTPQALCAAFGMHQHYAKTGDMRGVNWGQFGK